MKRNKQNISGRRYFLDLNAKIIFDEHKENTFLIIYARRNYRLDNKGKRGFEITTVRGKTFLIDFQESAR